MSALDAHPSTYSFSTAAWLGRFRAWQVALIVFAVSAVFALAVLPVAFILRSSLAIQQRGFDPSRFDPNVVGLGEQAFLFLTLLPFPLALLTLCVLVRALHKRRARTLATAPGRRLRWGRALAGGSVWLGLILISELLYYWLRPHVIEFVFDPSRFWPTAVVLLLLLPLQIAFEELALRGYLHQVVCRLFGKPWIAVLFTSVLFGALHLSNPEVARYGWTTMAVYYVGVGLFLALVATLDDGLELTLGIHLATNLAATLFVNSAHSALPTASVFRALEFDAKVALSLFALQALLFCAAFAKTGGWHRARLLQALPEASHHDPS